MIETKSSQSVDYYWATEKDPEKLSGFLCHKEEQFHDRLEASYYHDAIVRNWLYYHGLYFTGGTGWGGSAVRRLEGGDVLAAGINEYRSILDQIHHMVTKQRPSFEPRAKGTGQDCLRQARWGGAIMEDYLRFKGMETRLQKTVKHALVLSAGYVFHPWDRWAGERKFIPDLDQETGMAATYANGKPKGAWEAQGDFIFRNPTVFDVVVDLGVRDFEENRWVLVRTFENRWELHKQAEEALGKKAAQKVLDEEMPDVDDDAALFRWGMLGDYPFDADSTDIVEKWHFYHKPTDALPEGLWYEYAGSGAPLMEPQAFPYRREFPLSRTTAGEVLMSQLGHSPANDLQGPQELLNAEASTIATNHHGSGFNVIWVPDGAKLDEGRMGDGVAVVRGGQVPPKGIDFNADSPGRFKWLDWIIGSEQRISGMNAAARGEPEANLRSGEALKVMDAKALQATDELGNSWARCMEHAGTFVLSELPRMMGDDEERVLSLIGDEAKYQANTFQRAMVSDLDCIIVDVGNPLSRTVSGRIWIANMLWEREQIKTPQEFLTVLETGKLDPLLKASRAQIDLVKDENEGLRQGEPIEVDWLGEDHILHLREHGAEINSTDAKRDQEFSAAVRAHMMPHTSAILWILSNPSAFTAYQSMGHTPLQGHPLSMQAGAMNPGVLPEGVGGPPPPMPPPPPPVPPEVDGGAPPGPPGTPGTQNPIPTGAVNG